METVRVMEAFHNLFYSPFYVAQGLGLFEAEGIEIQARPRTQGEDIPALLREGKAEVTLSGIMRSLVEADTGKANYPVAFAEVNSRDGFMLVSRGPATNFRWSDLEGRTVITYREPPTPWMCFLRALKAEGVAWNRVTLSIDRTIPEAMTAFREGFGDYIELPEPLAQEFVVAGVGHVATAVGRSAGVIPFSSFAATRGLMDGRPDTILRFSRAVYAAQRWIIEHDAPAIAAIVGKLLPGMPVEVLVPGVERYLSMDTWAKDPLVRREGYDRLQDILQEGGLINGTFRYEDQVTTAFADAVMGEQPAG